MRLTSISFVIMIISLFACTSDTPKMTKINGTTVVQTDQRVLGVKINTKTKEVKTKEQKLDDLAVQKETREQELDLKTEERQSAAAFWVGLILIIAAPVCVIIGYLSQGWKFWGSLSVLCGLLGAAFWSFQHLIPYLKWPAFGIGAAAVVWSMYKFKDFSAFQKLKDSDQGKLF